MHGLIILSLLAIGWLALPLLVRNKINRLRIALDGLVRAVEKGGADPYDRATRIAQALREAKKVLGR